MAGHDGRKRSWQWEQRNRRMKKQRRQKTRDIRNRIQASTKTWEELKQESIRRHGGKK